MTKKLATFFSLMILSTILAGCTSQPFESENEKVLPAATPISETILVPVMPVDELSEKTTTEVSDDTLADTDKMLDELQEDSLIDLPSTLGQ